MRLLDSYEIAFVTGAEGSEFTLPPPEGETTTTTRRKNNNGYGNGAECGPPPGNSVKNPQLLTWNSGKRGAR